MALSPSSTGSVTKPNDLSCRGVQGVCSGRTGRCRPVDKRPHTTASQPSADACARHVCMHACMAQACMRARLQEMAPAKLQQGDP